MKAPARNVIQYLGSYLATCAAVWGVLMWYGRENPWVDRLIVGEIALCGLFVIVVMLRYTPRWKVRSVGIFGFMAAVVLLYITSQLVAAHVFGGPPKFAASPPPPSSPYWLRSVWRSMFAVAGPCMIVGYWQWWHEPGDADA